MYDNIMVKSYNNKDFGGVIFISPVKYSESSTEKFEIYSKNENEAMRKMEWHLFLLKSSNKALFYILKGKTRQYEVRTCPETPYRLTQHRKLFGFLCQKRGHLQLSEMSSRSSVCPCASDEMLA